MGANAKSTYRVIKRLSEEERDRVLKEFARLQEQEKTAQESG